MSAQLTSGAALQRLDAGELSLLLHPASELEAGLANLWLRRLDGGRASWTPLLGPAAPGSVHWTAAGPLVTGEWEGLRYAVTLRLADEVTAWFWHVSVTNPTPGEVTVDVVAAHDLALTPYGNVRVNEFYASQYLDVTPVATPQAGTALAVRQNMPGARVPWALVGSLRHGTGWATDALQLVGRDADGSRTLAALDHAELPSHRLQHEHTLAVVQDEPATLAPGETLRTGFFGITVEHHRAATSPEDADLAALALRQPEAVLPADAGDRDAAGERTPQTSSLFTAPAFAARDLTEAELRDLAGGLQHEERDGADLLSAFTPEGVHVVTAAKERRVLRPHGHILRTGNALVPDSGTLTSTTWMAGGFHSQVTQGHVSRGCVLSTRRTYLGLLRAHGLRVFVDTPTGWQLLDLPSAWAVTPGSSRWWYAAEDLLLEVTSTAPTGPHELGLAVRVLRGEPRRLLVSLHSALGEDDGQAPDTPGLDTHDAGAVVGAEGRGFTMAWPQGSVERVCRDETLFADGTSRGLPFVTLLTAPADAWSLTLTADVVPGDQFVEPGVREDRGADLWGSVRSALALQAPAGSPRAAEVDRLDQVLPWFAHDAFVHYLSPRGLEQFTGGGWGTRDVCQGPVGLLLSLDRTDALREVLLLVLRAQNARGDWPQAFDFLPPVPQQGQQGSHGDVVFWPLLALGEYLLASGDESLLTAEAPFTGDDGPTPAAPVLAHARRALDHIRASTVPGSPLPAYGHGDWNDSLQPADPQLAARLVSTWTATLQVHALRTLAAGLRAAAPTLALAGELADDAERLAEDTAAAMHEVLKAGGLLAGYGLFHDDGTVEHLVHPDDDRTGLTFGVLPWIHAISADLLSPEEADHHLAMICEHLLGPDGARLFDKPAAYRGGPMEVFQRAEGSTFWGREIGLMYTHAHLRYAEALARRGDAERLFEAFCLVNPVGMTERVAQARVRQATTYYSSSDGAFADRYEAAERYAELMAGEVELEGGWRVYSSGPGLFLRLLQECVLGLRRRGDRLEVDPVLPLDLDGLAARIPLGDTVVRVEFAVRGRTSGPSRVALNGSELPLTALTNPYRRAGVSVDLATLRAALTGSDDVLTVEIS